ncbi:MAG TPA: metallophosphoesterase [Candidatus Krumholzibacteria bacterium]
MTDRLRILRLLAVGLVLVAGGCSGCSGGGTPEATSPATVEQAQSIADPVVKLPNQDGSVKFAVLGDFGTGRKEQYDLGATMAKVHETFSFETVITVGDNIYGRQRAADFKNKFEEPYKGLLEKDVKFYASLGNHDLREQPSYKLFNMEGKMYYTLKLGDNVRFFMLDTSYMTPEQTDWIKKELEGSNDEWKIAAFHHPLYSSGGRHGSDIRLRQTLEPLFVENGVSVVLTGHDHFYERIKPQHGIVYFVAGSGGKLAPGDINKSSPLTARGFDTGLAFMVVEIVGDKMYFNTITTNGSVVDSGIIQRRMPVKDQKPEQARQSGPTKAKTTQEGQSP